MGFQWDRPVRRNNTQRLHLSLPRSRARDYFFPCWALRETAGRFFNDHDDAKGAGSGAPQRGTAARARGPTSEPIGQFDPLTTRGPTPGKCLVIGVVGDVDVRQASIRSRTSRFFIIPRRCPRRDDARHGSAACRRGGGRRTRPAAFAEALRNTVAALDKDGRSSVKPMDDLYSRLGAADASICAPRRLRRRRAVDSARSDTLPVVIRSGSRNARARSASGSRSARSAATSSACGVGRRCRCARRSGSASPSRCTPRDSSRKYLPACSSGVHGIRPATFEIAEDCLRRWRLLAS